MDVGLSHLSLLLYQAILSNPCEQTSQTRHVSFCLYLLEIPPTLLQPILCRDCLRKISRPVGILNCKRRWRESALCACSKLVSFRFELESGIVVFCSKLPDDTLANAEYVKGTGVRTFLLNLHHHLLYLGFYSPYVLEAKSASEVSGLRNVINSHCLILDIGVAVVGHP